MLSPRIGHKQFIVPVNLTRPWKWPREFHHMEGLALGVFFAPARADQQYWWLLAGYGAWHEAWAVELAVGPHRDAEVWKAAG